MTDLKNRIQAAAESLAYKKYIEVRQKVLAMMHLANEDGKPSRYWTEEIAGFEYFFDASPLVIEKLREHCYHLTGLRSYEYRLHHRHQAALFEKKWHELKSLDKKGLFVPEAQALGGFGHTIEGNLINIDTLKFYESLLALEKAGLLEKFRAGEANKVIEIGAGWGGFAYAFKTLFPSTHYVIVDLPETLLFSAVYLAVLFPKAKTFFYEGQSTEEIKEAITNHDFIFIPHFALDKKCPKGLDLAVNIASFQEMTTEQVERYGRGLFSSGCAAIYSHNRECSPHNLELSAVSKILSEFYRLHEVKILDYPYTVLSRAKDNRPWLGAIRRLMGKKPQKSPENYRHFAGRL